MEDETKYVDVSYKINCMSHIDAVTSTYYIDVKLFFHWTDPKFIGRKKGESVDIKTEASWNPEIIVTNEHELSVIEEHREVKITNSSTGEVKSSIQYRGTLFINNMDLATFPFDCQNLQICLKPYKLEIEKVVLRPRRDESAIENQDSHEWNVLGHFMKAFATDPNASSTRKSYSTMYITVLVQRQSNWFIQNVVVLIGLLLLYDWFAFLIPPDDTQGKLDLTNTALLASIAHKFVVGDELPKVPYRTLLDYYVDGCFLLQFLVVISIFIVYYVEIHHVYEEEEGGTHRYLVEKDVEGGMHHLFAWKLNWILLSLNVFLYLILCGYIALKVFYVRTDIEHWLNIADLINRGQGDANTENILDIHHMTTPQKSFAGHWLIKNRIAKSKFLHFGGQKEKIATEGGLSMKTSRPNSTGGASLKVYAVNAEVNK